MNDEKRKKKLGEKRESFRVGCVCVKHDRNDRKEERKRQYTQAQN